LLRVLLLAIATGCSAPLPTSTATRELPAAQATLALGGGRLSVDTQIVATGEVLQGLPQVIATLSERRSALESASARDPSAAPFRGVLLIEADGRADAADLIAALERIGAAGWRQPWLVVVGPDQQRRGIKLDLAAVDAGRVAAATASAPERATGGYVNPRLHLDPTRGVRVRAFDRTVDPGGGLWLPCAATPCGDRWPHVELNRLARRLKLDHRRDRAVLVSAARGVRVQDLVDTLDSTRDDAPTAAGAREIFPTVVISSQEAP